MIKRLAVSFVLTATLVVGSGLGVASASSNHIHGFQKCMQDARVAYHQALADGQSKTVARMQFHDAQQKCRQNFQHPRGK